MNKWEQNQREINYWMSFYADDLIPIVHFSEEEQVQRKLYPPEDYPYLYAENQRPIVPINKLTKFVSDTGEI